MGMGGVLALDHVVHINNGSGAAKPIVLRLLPGEETIFNLKILNHGEPSNISLLASSPVLKAVRLKKPDHYVVLEEIIPILARMPANKKRLDGEILLSSSGGERRVPITLLRDSEDPGDDLEDPDLQGDEELKDDDVDEEDEDADDEGEDEDEEDFGRVRRVKRSEDDYEDEDEDEGKEKKPRRLAFSRDKDLQTYRSATRRKIVDRTPVSPGKSDRSEIYGNVRAERGRDGEIESAEDDDSSIVENRFRARIDDRFVDSSNRQDDGPRFIPRQVPLGKPEEWKEERTKERTEGWPEEQKRATDYEDRYQRFSPETDGESRVIPAFATEMEDGSERTEERAPEEPEVYVERDDGPEDIYLDRLGNLGALGAHKVIPVALFLALVTVLVLTFITQSIPEFPGALASSILIVTLIIYGAATLLKA